LNTYN